MNNDNAEAAPDFLSAPKKRKEVRRLNHLPLVVLGSLILFAVVGISYTFLSRGESNVAAPSTPKVVPRVNTVAEPPVKPNAHNYLSAYVEPSIPAENGGAPTENKPVTNESVIASPQSEAKQRRLQMIHQMEEKRLAKWDEALESEGVVQTFNRSHQENSPPAMPLMSSQPGMNLQDGFQQHRVGAGLPENLSGNSLVTENRQDQKRAFLSDSMQANTYLMHQRKAAPSPTQEIKAGTVIPGVMISGINSDLPGHIIGQVSEGVYDSATGTQLLIPPGARLLGTYDSSVTLGQQRVLVAWQRIIYPDGSSISLDNMPGSDQGGYAGFYDKANNHYFRVFGTGLLLSVLTSGTQLSQPKARHNESDSSAQIMAGALGQQMGQIGMQMAQRNMNIQPTLAIRPGYEFNVMVTKDMMLPTWQGHPDFQSYSQHPVKTAAMIPSATMRQGEPSQPEKEKMALRPDFIAKNTKKLTKVGAGGIDSLPVIKKPSEPAPTVMWRAELGSTLKDTLFRWSSTQTCHSGGNWRVIWETPVNYSIDAPLSFNGDFYAALQGLFALYQSAQHPLYAALNRAQCLLKVTDKALR